MYLTVHRIISKHIIVLNLECFTLAFFVRVLLLYFCSLSVIFTLLVISILNFENAWIQIGLNKGCAGKLITLINKNKLK